MQRNKIHVRELKQNKKSEMKRLQAVMVINYNQKSRPQCSVWGQDVLPRSCLKYVSPVQAVDISAAVSRNEKDKPLRDPSWQSVLSTWLTGTSCLCGILLRDAGLQPWKKMRLQIEESEGKLGAHTLQTNARPAARSFAQLQISALRWLCAEFTYISSTANVLIVIPSSLNLAYNSLVTSSTVAAWL